MVYVLKFTFLFLYSNTMLVFRTGFQYPLVRIANMEGPDQTASTPSSFRSRCNAYVYYCIFNNVSVMYIIR